MQTKLSFWPLFQVWLSRAQTSPWEAEVSSLSSRLGKPRDHRLALQASWHRWLQVRSPLMAEVPWQKNTLSLVQGFY